MLGNSATGLGNVRSLQLSRGPRAVFQSSKSAGSSRWCGPLCPLPDPICLPSLPWTCQFSSGGQVVSYSTRTRDGVGFGVRPIHYIERPHELHGVIVGEVFGHHRQAQAERTTSPSSCNAWTTLLKQSLLFTDVTPHWKQNMAMTILAWSADSRHHAPHL